MIHPKIEEYNEWSKTSKIIPVSYEKEADTETPISLFKKFKNNEYSYLFESVEGGRYWARYSFMCRNPILIFKSKDYNVTIKTRDEQKTYIGNPFVLLDNLLTEYKSISFPHLPRFYGGVAGYFGYDMIKSIEKIEDKGEDEIITPDCHLMIPEEIIIFDHLKQKTYIIVNTFSDIGIEGFNSSIDKINHIIKEISVNEAGKEKTSDIKKCSGEFISSISKKDFCHNVKKTLK